MTTYTKIVDYAAKDLLLTGDPAKVVKGTEIGAEFDSIAAADATNIKNTGNQNIDGTKTFSSPIAGSVTGNAATVTVADAAADTTTWPMLATSQTGDQAPTTDAGITYNASTNELTIAGPLNLSGAASGQVKFPAAQNASADVNTLDDYEESTWTPVLTFATPGDLSVTYAVQVGTYTKIGNKVFADMFVQTSAFTHTTAAGQLQITGLPFTSVAVKHNGLFFSGITKAGYSYITSATAAASTILGINASGSGVAFSTVIAADVPTGGTVVLVGQIIYTV